eukprot:119566-Rhodomonas_salina.1
MRLAVSSLNGLLPTHLAHCSVRHQHVRLQVFVDTHVRVVDVFVVCFCAVAAQVSRAPVQKAGLGLTFLKPDGAPGVVIKRVKEGGAAEATGRIVPGDR